MKPFCEIVVQNVLPGIRALIAKELMERHSLTQKDVALRLGVTQAAISQYMRQLRGLKIKILQKDRTVTEEIEKLAGRIAAGELTAVTAMTELCEICKTIRKNGLICDLHKQAFPDLEKCKICV